MVRDKEGKNLSDDTWVRVEGDFSAATINGRQVSSLGADRVQPVSMPPPEKRDLFFQTIFTHPINPNFDIFDQPRKGALHGLKVNAQALRI